MKNTVANYNDNARNINDNIILCVYIYIQLRISYLAYIYIGMIYIGNRKSF